MAALVSRVCGTKGLLVTVLVIASLSLGLRSRWNNDSKERVIYPLEPAFTRKDAMKVTHGLATALYMDKALEAMRNHISKSKTDVSLDELTEAYGRSLLLREELRFKAPSDNYPKTATAALILQGEFRSLGSRVMIASLRSLGTQLRQAGFEPKIFALIKPSMRLRCQGQPVKRVPKSNVSAVLDEIGMPYHLRIMDGVETCENHADFAQTSVARNLYNCGWADHVVRHSNLMWRYTQTLGYVVAYDSVLAYENQTKTRFSYVLRVRTDLALSGNFSRLNLTPFVYVENDLFSVLPREYAPYFFFGEYDMIVRVALCHAQKDCEFFDIVEPAFRAPDDALGLGFCQPSVAFAYYGVPFFGKDIDIGNHLLTNPKHLGHPLKMADGVRSIIRMTHEQDACVEHRPGGFNIHGVHVPECLCNNHQ